MDVLLSYRPTFWSGLPFSIQVIIVGVVAALAYTTYSTFTVDRPLKGFPVVALSEKGLSSKWSWFTSSTETIAKGLKEHDGPFQIITSTGPKVYTYEHFGLRAQSLTVIRSYFQTASLTSFALAMSSTSPKPSKKSSLPTTLVSKPTSKA
jgi:hypothetical protein